MKLSLSNLEKHSNNTLVFDKNSTNGQLRLANYKQKTLRWILPGYARKQDAQVAHQIYLHMKSQNLGQTEVQSISRFLKKKLTPYYFGSIGNITNVSKELYSLVSIYRLSEQLKIDQNVLRNNPEFVKFASKNRLMYRFPKSHFTRGLGPKVQNGKILFPFRKDDEHDWSFKEWTELDKKEYRDAKGLIDPQKMELLAWGWQEPKEIAPAEIIEASEKKGYPATFGLELVTVPPSYRLKDIGVGLFGHSYIRAYELLEGSEYGTDEGKLAVYPIGYNLKRMLMIDFMETRPREKISTYRKFDEDIDTAREKFKTGKSRVQTLFDYYNDRKSLSAEKLKKAEQWVETNCITCVNVASGMMNEGVKVKLDARNRVEKTVFNRFVTKITDGIFKHLPSSMQHKMRKIKLLTRGMFPRVMYKKQKKLSSFH